MNFNFCPNCGREGTVEKFDNTNYECSTCQWHFWNNAKAATAIALVRDKQLLVVQRAHEPNKGKFELAGGFVEFGEDPYQSAIIDLAFLVTKWQGEIVPADDVAAAMWRPFDFIYDADFCQKYYVGLDTVIAAKLAE